MRNRTIILTLSALLALALSSCVKEPNAGDQTGEKVTVQIQTKALEGGTIEGVKVDKIRLLLFDQSGALVVNNTTSSETLIENPDEKFAIDVEPGSYRFVSIINETPGLTAQLNALKFYSEVGQIKEEWQSDVFTNENLPLANYGSMEIAASAVRGQGVGRVTEFDATGPNTTPPTSPITITMPRALAKVSLFMRKGDVTEDVVVINRVEVVNIPHQWSLQQQEITQTGNAHLFVGTKTIESAAGEIDYADKKYHNLLTSGRIIPEKYFPPYSGSGDDKATIEANAAYLFITATFGGVPTSYKVLLRESDANFRLLRNTNYNVYVTISGIGAKGIYVVIQPVKMYDITVNWKPVEGLVVVSDREADFGKNINVWNDYTAYSGILKVYQGSIYSDVLFKYGSLMAINNDAAATDTKEFIPPTSAAVTNDIIWYPGAYQVQNITGWEGVPYLSDDRNFTTGNTPELVTAGKGDPCRLVALTPHQIGVEGKIDNQQWHMANPAEYALLMKAANGAGSENDNGYRSFHELLIPNVKYRDASGKLTATHNNEGRYWSSEGSLALAFNSTAPTAATFRRATPEQAYTVRCVRNTIPAPDISFANASLFFFYTGNEVNGLPFGITSNVPYWKIELIKSGEGVGTSTDFDDLSFTPFASGVTHSIKGGYSAEPRVYVKRRVSRTENRTFGIRFSSIHYDGRENVYDFMVTQKKYEIHGQLTIDGLDDKKWLSASAQKYMMHVDLTPNDVPMPIGAKLKVVYTYLGITRGQTEEFEITAENNYQYDIEMNVVANGTPDVIGLVFDIYMDEGSGYLRIGNNSFYQNK